MIHFVQTLLPGSPSPPATGKAAKTGVETAMLAMFGEALANQLRTVESVPGALSAATNPRLAAAAVDSLSDMPDPGLAGAAGEVLTLGQENLPSAAAGDIPDASGMPAQAVLVPPGDVPVTNVPMPMTPLPEGVDPRPDVPLGGEPSARGRAVVPAAFRNPLALAGQKNLPLTPAGVAASQQAFAAGQGAEARTTTLPMEAPVEILEVRMQPGPPDAALRLPSLAAGGEALPDGARPASIVAGFTGVPSVPAATEGAAASRHLMQLTQPFGQAQWQTEFGDKLVWLAARQSQVAELSLNPPSLGSIEVRLHVSGGETGAQFFSANPVVRELLESALPRLRDMMADAGLALGNAMVSSEPFSQHDPSDRPQGETGGRARGGVMTVDNLAGGTASRIGLVDLYV